MIEDQWDDWFEYNTMYDLWIVDENLNKKYIGKIKIGQFNMEGKVRANIPKKFEYLSSEFFSLGQDSYYYENIKNLNISVRENIFKNLNDIAFDKNLLKKSYAENVTKKSLLRGIEKETVEKQFHRIATGGPRLVPYKFVYESYVETKEETAIKMTFEIDPESFPPSNIHVLMGRNGVGKTRLITQIINTILKNNRKSSNTFGTVFFAEDEDRYNVLFNPYFDDIRHIHWLHGTLDHSNNKILSITFKVALKQKNKILEERLKNYFKTFKLNNLYSKCAARHFIDITTKHILRIKRFGYAKSKDSIAADIEETLEALEISNINGWKTVAYRTLKFDSWYLDYYLRNYDKLS